MTGPGDDSQKHKSEDAAKYLAESFFGLNLNPADVGGEVLFDDYDDVRPARSSEGDDAQFSSSQAETTQVFASKPGVSGTTSLPNRFEENLDDLIVFSDDDDDDDDRIEDEEDEEDDDENFDFGDDDDDDEEDEEEEDFDGDDDEEDEEDEDELDDADLDFGDDLIDPVPKKSVPVARESRSVRDDREAASRTSPSRSDRDSSQPREAQRADSGGRGDRPSDSAARRGGRSEEFKPARADSRGSDRPTPAKDVDPAKKAPKADEDYWNELDGWVWDDEKKKKPAAVSASRPSAVDDDEDDDSEEVIDTVAADGDESSEDSPKPRRGRRRGGRGRGRGRRDEKDPAAPVAPKSDAGRGNVDFDDDFSEIMFEEDLEDFVSVSAGSAAAQRRIQNDPKSQEARGHSSDSDEDEDDDAEEEVERSETGEARPGGARRGRRGRRGRGRGREDSREPVRAEDRPAVSPRRPARDEDDMDDDDDDVELADFSDSDDEEVPRRREGVRGDQSRNEPARSEQPPRRGQGQGRGPRDREGESTERPRRPSAREPQPVDEKSGSDPQSRSRQPRVAAEFQDIPTWEEAIGSLAIRTPTEEHARRAENRGRRDSGGRPPRRRN